MYTTIVCIITVFVTPRISVGSSLSYWRMLLLLWLVQVMLMRCWFRCYEMTEEELFQFAVVVASVNVKLIDPLV